VCYGMEDFGYLTLALKVGCCNGKECKFDCKCLLPLTFGYIRFCIHYAIVQTKKDILVKW